MCLFSVQLYGADSEVAKPLRATTRAALAWSAILGLIGMVQAHLRHDGPVRRYLTDAIPLFGLGRRPAAGERAATQPARLVSQRRFFGRREQPQYGNLVGNFAVEALFWRVWRLLWTAKRRTPL